MKILTIAKREFLNFFNQPVGYIFFVAFIGVSYFLFFRQIFLSGYASVRPYTLNIPMLLAVIIPALTMATVAGEKSNKTLETVITAPVSPLQFIIGKFVGTFFIYLLMIAITLTIPTSLSLYGKFDWGVVLTSYLGLAFLGMLFVSIGVLISTLTDNQIVAFVISLVTIISFVLLGSDSVTMGLPPFFASIVSSFGAFSRINSFDKGVLDLRDAIYFISFSLFFLALSAFILSQGRISKGSRFLSYTLKTTVAALFAGVVLLNFFVKPLFIRLDLTRDKVYTLSPTTKDILRKLDGNTLLVFYYSKELPPEFAERKDALMDLLKDFSMVPGNKLKIEYKETSSPEEEQNALSDGITPVQFNTVRNDEFQAKKGLLGIVAKNGEDKEPIAFLESTEGLEYQTITLVRRVSGGSNKKVAFLQDAKSLGLYSDLATFRDELSKYYQATTLSLVKEPKDKEEKIIPVDTDILVLAGPKEPLDSGTNEKIKKFVDSGKALIVFGDSYDISISTLSPTENKNNIDDTLAPYGISLNKDLIFDLQNNERINLNQGFFTYVLPYPYFARVTLTGEGKNLLGNIAPVLTAWGSDLELKNVEGIKQTVIAKSSSSAGSDEGTTIDVSPNKNFSKSNLKERSVAVLAENQSGGKVIVISNDDMITKDFYGANSSFALNLFDLATNDKGFVAIRAKSSIPSPLVFKSETEKNAVKYGNLVGVPLLMVIFGLVRLKMRSLGFGRKHQSI